MFIDLSIYKVLRSSGATCMLRPSIYQHVALRWSVEKWVVAKTIKILLLPRPEHRLIVQRRNRHEKTNSRNARLRSHCVGHTFRWSGVEGVSLIQSLHCRRRPWGY